MKDFTKIVSLILGISVITLLVNRSQDSSRVIREAGGTFNTLLQTLTLQSSNIGGIGTPGMFR